MRKPFISLLFLFGLLAAPGARAQVPADLEIRFCPTGRVHPYPLDSLRGLQSLLLQNIAAINRSGADIEISAVEIALLRGGEAVDVRRLGGPDLQRAAAGGHGLQAQGALDLLKFQFCDGSMLQGAPLAESPRLGAGQALLVMQQVFAYRGQRDEVRVTVTGSSAGRPVQASAVLRVDPAVSTAALRWPLRGGPWTVGAASSFHTTHRWGVPEEFALDIFAVGANGRSWRRDGAANRDFLAYSADVVAVADGDVARVITGAGEAPPMLRAPGEDLTAYYARISARQAANLAAGEAATLGETVILDHGNSEYSVYAHLVPGSIRVTAGQHVDAGQVIARLGSSGNSTEPHLHFQLCDRPSGLSCAGIVPHFRDIELPLADGPRPLQSGDLVISTADH